MFNYSTVKTGLSGLIGFKSAYDPDIPALDAALTSSVSGVYMDEIHPLLATDTLEKTVFDFDGQGYDAYSTATYSEGEYVISSDIAWISKEDDNAGNTPAAGTYWKTAFSDYLDSAYDASINKLLSKLSIHKKLLQNTKTYLENVQLFDGTSRNGDTISASGRFVGFLIELKKYNNIKAVVDRIGLRFTQKQTDLTLYLFHSSRNTAVATTTVSTTGGYNFEWKTPDWELDYVDYANNIDAGGKWIIGYFEADITGNAINKNYDFSSHPCSGCGSSDEYFFNLWSKYMRIKPIEVTSSNLNGTDLFDLSNMGISWTQNWGLNIAFSVKSDFSEMAVNNKMLFVDPLGKQFAVDMLNKMAYNPHARVNRHETNNELVALQALAGGEGQKGMEQQLEESINALAEDFAGISPVLPIERRGLDYGAI